MKTFFTVVVCAFALTGCTDEVRSTEALQNAGFSDIQMTGYEMFICGEDDTFKTGFRAKNVNGIVVTGAVCCGFIGKGCTIRF